MDATLKEKLAKIAEATLKDLKVGGVKVTLQMMVRRTHLPVAKNARILAARDMQRRLQNARMWTAASEDMCREWMGEFLTGILRKEQAAQSKVAISAARERQLALFPGFESLPTRIRHGKGFLKFPDTPVPDFLKYAAKYEQRSQRDQKAADELRRLARLVEPFAELEITVAAAFERAQFQRPALAIVK